MTREEKARFDALKNEGIDYSDIPELGAEAFAFNTQERPGG